MQLVPSDKYHNSLRPNEWRIRLVSFGCNHNITLDYRVQVFCRWNILRKIHNKVHTYRKQA